MFQVVTNDKKSARKAGLFLDHFSPSILKKLAISKLDILVWVLAGVVAMKTLTNQIKGTVGGAQLAGFIITIGFQNFCFESVAFKVINRLEYNDVDFFKESSHKTSEVTRSNNNNN